MITRKPGTVWKDLDPFVRAKPWYVQFPKGIIAFNTLREARLQAKAIVEKVR